MNINMPQFAENVLANLVGNAVTDQENSDILRATLIGVCEINNKVEGLLKALDRPQGDTETSDELKVYVITYYSPDNRYIDTVYKNRDDALARLRHLCCELYEKYEDDDDYKPYIITDGTEVGVTFQGSPYAEYILEEQEVL